MKTMHFTPSLHHFITSSLALVAAVLIAGCASTPQAPRESDSEAKQFTTHPSAATIYVYRDDFAVGPLGMQDTALYLDGRIIGMALPKTFFRINARPGPHLLHGYAYDQGKLKFDTRSGELYFVSLKVTDGTSHFALVNPDTAKREIARCCALLETWAPGQRPLLR
jgi:hypothetical protein